MALTNQTITFDGFVNSPSVLNTTFAGLSFSDTWHPAPGSPADPYLALSMPPGTANIIRAADNSDFYVHSIDAWSRRGLDANGKFYWYFFNQTGVVYNGLAVITDPSRPDRTTSVDQVFTGTHMTYASPYTGPVRGFAFLFAQGGDDWDHFAVDNLNVSVNDSLLAPTAPVPEPETYAMFLLGLMFIYFAKNKFSVE